VQVIAEHEASSKDKGRLGDDDGEGPQTLGEEFTSNVQEPMFVESTNTTNAGLLEEPDIDTESDAQELAESGSDEEQPLQKIGTKSSNQNDLVKANQILKGNLSEEKVLNNALLKRLTESEKERQELEGSLKKLKMDLELLADKLKTAEEELNMYKSGKCVYI
jgi:chromosome segregation ATPase